MWWGDILGDPQWIIAWVKKNGQGQTGLGGTNKWDSILVYGVDQDHDIDIVEINNDYSEGIKAKGGHPTAKPIELWQHIIKRFNGRIVYEPFAGSGTTLVACQNLNRKCYAIEISENYCAVILERMQTAFPDIEIKRVEDG
jgi:DNA modification methylase